MYDFYFGEPQQVLENDKDFLLTVKRMMPRWCNSIPDSEFMAIYNDLASSQIANPASNGVIIETGCGASTIVLAHFAFKFGKQLYTWEINQNKLSYIKSIIVDTIEKLFRRSVYEHWIPVPYVSTSPDLGLPILRELGKRVDFGFFDSEHTHAVLGPELDFALGLVNDGAVIALDDANYNFKFKNTAYINVMRKKLGLGPIASDASNLGESFCDMAHARIRQKFPASVKIDDTYKQDYKNDLFWQYFANDRNIMNNLEMEKLSQLEHRYDSFRIRFQA